MSREACACLKSPSKVFHGVGEFSDEGLAEGAQPADVVLVVGNERPATLDRAGRQRRVKIVREDGQVVREEPLEKVQEKIVEKRLLASELSEAVKCLGCKDRVGYPRTTKGKIGKGPRYCDECVGEYVRKKKREARRKWKAANPEKKREAVRKWHAAHKDLLKERRRARRAKKSS